MVSRVFFIGFYVCHLNLCVGAILGKVSLEKDVPYLSGINQIKLVFCFLNEAVSEQYFIPRL